METAKNDWKEKKQATLQVAVSNQPLKTHHRCKPPQSTDGIKLAALAIRLDVRLRLADMPISMQERALLFSRSLLNAASTNPSSASDHHHCHRRSPSPTILARSLKKEFDSSYGPAWHCVVGKSFGSSVTHSPGGFIFFSVDSLSFRLFKTQVRFIHE